MASLLSIIRTRHGETLTARKEHWLLGLEKSDRLGFEAGQDPEATEDDCPYTKRPYRDCWLEAFRRARGVEDAAKALNEFGVATDVWSCMSEFKRQRYWTRRWYHGRMKEDPLLFAKYKDRQVVHNNRIRERWAENPEFFCAKMREVYWKDVDTTRAKGTENYRKNIERERARGRRRVKAEASKRAINRSPDEIYSSIVKPLPKALPGHARDEVASTMWKTPPDPLLSALI